MEDCNCNCSTTIYQVCHNGCCDDNLCELDRIIANLKTELFERQQNLRNYCELESKCIQLQNDIQSLSDQKKCLEFELCKVGENGNKLICNLRTENENLKNELNEKNSLNKKLYGDNNNLFQVLEGKTTDNQNLQDQMCQQENVLCKLNQDKSNLENTIFSLKQLKDKHMKDIKNLNTQINILNKNSNDLDNSLRNTNCENMQVINDFNKAKNLNNDLIDVLKGKENSLLQTQKELCMANDTLSKLEKDIDCLNFSNKRNNDDINCTNNNLLKETAMKNELENNNSKLNSTINVRDLTIEKITNENNLLKNTNTNINRDNNFLNSKLEAYKKHIIILTDQNEKLSAELEAIVCRDSQLLCTLGRDTHLRALQQENNNNINSSLDYLKSCNKFNGGLSMSKFNHLSKNENNDDIKGSSSGIGNGNITGKFGMNMNGTHSSLHNSRINMRNEMGNNSGDEQQYSGGEEEQYSGGEEMKYSDGEEGLGQSSGEENQ